MSLESWLLSTHPLQSASCREVAFSLRLTSETESREMPFLTSRDSTQSKGGHGDLSWLKGGAGNQQEWKTAVLRTHSSCLSSVFLASGLKSQEGMGCSLLTTQVTQGISQSPRVSQSLVVGWDLVDRSLSALAVTIVNSWSIVRSLWLFITSLFAGASARRSIDSEMADQLITVLKQGSLTSLLSSRGL